MAFGSYSLEPQSTAPHLLSTSASMTCSSEVASPLLISPPCIQTFEWSDFPLVCRSIDDHTFKPSLDDSSASILETVDTRPIKKVAMKEANSRRTHKKKVSFSNLEIREYSVVFGDHPSCANLPLTLGWGHSEEEIIDLNAWEQSRAGYRRHGHELRLTYFERKNVLKRVGGMSESDLVGHQHHRSSGDRIHVNSPLRHVPTTRTLGQWTANEC